MRTSALLTGLLLLTLLVTPAFAIHGERAIASVRLDDGRELPLIMVYQREALGQQVWAVYFIEVGQDPWSCNGYGTLETGFNNA